MPEIQKYGWEIEPYLDKVADIRRIRKLNQQIFEHEMCHCFSCIIKRLMIRVLIKRDDQRYLFYSNTNNYNDMSDEEVLRKIVNFLLLKKWMSNIMSAFSFLEKWLKMSLWPGSFLKILSKLTIIITRPI